MSENEVYVVNIQRLTGDVFFSDIVFVSSSYDSAVEYFTACTANTSDVVLDYSKALIRVRLDTDLSIDGIENQERLLTTKFQDLDFLFEDETDEENEYEIQITDK